MASDLTVEENQTRTLSAEHEDVERRVIGSLNDFVELHMVDSEENVRVLLGAAQRATASALSRGVASQTEGGPARPDLGRFGEFVAEAHEVDPNQAKSVWQVLRKLPPVMLKDSAESGAEDLAIFDAAIQKMPHRDLSIFKIKLDDITIKSGATLQVDPSLSLLECQHLLIEFGGRMAVSGSGLYINAFSIQGSG